MNIRKFIDKNVIVWMLALLLMPVEIFSSEISFLRSIVKIPWPEDENLCNHIEEILFTLPCPGWSEPRYMLIPNHVSNWTEYREAVDYILQQYQDPGTLVFLVKYYMLQLSEKDWNTDGNRMMMQLIKHAASRTEWNNVYRQALEVVLFKGSMHQIIELMADEKAMPVIIQFFEENFSPEAFQLLTNYYEGKDRSYFEMKTEYESSKISDGLNRIRDRIRFYNSPIEDIPKEFFDIEGKRQFEKLSSSIGQCVSLDWNHPPDDDYGARLVKKYWGAYRLGAYYFLEEGKIGTNYEQFLNCILCDLDNQDTSEILRRILISQHRLGELSEFMEMKVAACYSERVSTDALNKMCSRYLSVFSMNTSYYNRLVSRFGEIGNESSLEKLKEVRPEWKKRDHTSTLSFIDRAILSIECRLAKKED